MAKVLRKHIHFTVPESDEKTLAWLDAQENRSISLRKLIQQAYDRRGPVDMLDSRCDEPRQRRTNAEIASDAQDALVRENVLPSDQFKPAAPKPKPAPEPREQRASLKDRMLSGALADFGGITNADADAAGASDATDAMIDIKQMMGR